MILTLLLLAPQAMALLLVPPITIAQFPRTVTVHVPAVTQTEEGVEGVITNLTVMGQPGSGHVYIDTMPLTEIDMQGSARLAVAVAERVTGIDTGSWDFFFVIRSNATITGGPSAGAVMAVAAIAVLNDWPIKPAVMMTGMINPDGTLGTVSGIVEKATAARDAGATLFLIPKGQGNYTELHIEEHRIGPIIHVTRSTVTIDLVQWGKEHGIEVKEVYDVYESLALMTGHQIKRSRYGGEVITPEYTEVMGEAASMAIENAESASKQLSYIKRRTHADKVREGQRQLDLARELYTEEHYYPAYERALQATACFSFVQLYGSDLSDEIEETAAQIKEINGPPTRTDVLAMAQHQLVGAERGLDDARAAMDNHRYTNALWSIALAKKMVTEAGFWLGLPEYFSEPEDFPEHSNEIASRHIANARSSVIYAFLIVGDEQAELMDEAVSALELAENEEERGWYAAAILDAIEAEVKANMALELLDDADPRDRLSYARDGSKEAILGSRSQGPDPVPAVAYYEMGVLNEETDPSQGLVAYKISMHLACLAQECYTPPASLEDATQEC